MIFDEDTNNIIMYKGDYGTALTFKVKGASAGDSIVFCFESMLEDKSFEVDNEEEFVFELSFTKDEVSDITAMKYGVAIPYSVKQYDGDVLLSTLINANLLVKETVLHDQ